MNKSKMIIAGGSGLIGRALARHADGLGWDVAVLSREEKSVGVGQTVVWDGETSGAWVRLLGDADVVVNLCGASIGQGRWTQKRKAEIRDSRILSSRCLIEAIGQSGRTPKLLQASAVGFYGAGTETLTEEDGPGDDYLSRLAIEWEAATEHYPGQRVLARFGVVLDTEEGALPKMVLPFKWFAGGKLGSGHQWFSWIALQDAVNAIMFALNEGLTGPVNIVAPNPITNRAFAQALGQALHRPSFLSTPGVALRAILGEQATLLLEGQKVVPDKLINAGFKFAYRDVESALAALFHGEDQGAR